jgi:hypothetical protein
MQLQTTLEEGHRVTGSDVATPTKHEIFGTEKLRDPIGQDVGKHKPSVTTSIMATPTKYATITAGEFRMPLEKTLENLRSHKTA